MPQKSTAAKDSTAKLGCEATARRGVASLKIEAIQQSMEGNLRLSADTSLRDSALPHTGGTLQVMTETQDNLRNNMDAAETSGARKTAAGSPKGERGGANQCKHVVLGLIFIKYISRGGQLGDISIYGQDKRARRQRPFGLATRARRVRLRRQQPKQSNPTTRRLAIMNLALRGIEADFGPENADTFRRDLHPDLRADTATRVSAKPQPRSHLAGLLRSERQLFANN